ncbi:MAG: nuclear transport factor 2 family protein, partial [Deltaproteobacteria bacterium]|nr:nuclear transport factor 2 family protein [Deltaproteobacteria bacterium]
MRLWKTILALVVVCVFINQVCIFAGDAGSEQSQGEQLLRQLWEDMRKADTNALERKLAKGFQSVHQYGASNREQEIELLKNLNFDKYTLSNIQITQDGPVIVATYFVSVGETIKGQRLSKEPAPRLSVFLKTDSGWQWIAHANLKPL